jgi:hypothetical protein
MSIKQEVRKTEPDDIEYLIENVRPEDEEEVKEFSGETVREVLEGTPELDKSQVWVVDGKIVCMFGVTPLPKYPKTGLIWLLATPDFHKHTKSFAVRNKAVFEEVIKDYEYVFNYVLSKNEDSVRWLTWLGFNMGEPQPIGKTGANFNRFELLNV